MVGFYGKGGVSEVQMLRQVLRKVLPYLGTLLTSFQGGQRMYMYICTYGDTFSRGTLYYFRSAPIRTNVLQGMMTMKIYVDCA